MLVTECNARMGISACKKYWNSELGLVSFVAYNYESSMYSKR
jgi:hypothetical protein